MNIRAVFVCLFIGLAVVLAACSRGPSENTESDNIEFSLNYSVSSPALAAAVSTHRVTVTSVATGDTLATDSQADDLTPFVSFTIIDLPANVPLLFTVESTDGTSGTVVYSGSTEASIEPGRVTSISMDLTPQVPLQRFDSRYLRVQNSQSFGLQTQVYNLNPLFGISWETSWSDSVGLRLDSALLAPQYSPNEVLFFVASDSTTPSSYSFAITHTLTNGNLAEATDPTTLASLFFTNTSVGGPASDSVLIQVLTTGYNRTSADTVPLTAGVYNDDVLIEFVP